MSLRAGLSLWANRRLCFWVCLVLWLQFLAHYTLGRTWNDIDLFHNSTIDGTPTVRPGNPYEKDPFSFDSLSDPPPSTSNNVFAHVQPTPSPSQNIRNDNETRSPSATFSQPTQQEHELTATNLPTKHEEEEEEEEEDVLPFYPENSDPPPPRPPAGYFNYDSSQDETFAIYGPGFPVMEYTKNNGLGVVYANNGWAAGSYEFPPPPLYYWDEFGPQGFGPWQETLTERQMRQNQCGNVGRQSPIDIRLTGVACVEHHQIRTKVSTSGKRGLDETSYSPLWSQNICTSPQTIHWVSIDFVARRLSIDWSSHPKAGFTEQIEVAVPKTTVW
jgi:hypothetical protein